MPLTAELNKAPPILLRHRDCGAPIPRGEVWAFYFPEDGAWVKAWRIFEGPLAPGSP